MQRKIILILFVIFLGNYIYLFDINYNNLKIKNDISLRNINRLKVSIKSKNSVLKKLEERINMQNEYINNINNSIQDIKDEVKKYEE